VTAECAKDADCELGSGCNFTLDLGQLGGIRHLCTP
jgi:hypothetical protein